MSEKSLFFAMSRLRSVLRTIENDLNIVQLTDSELDVLAAAIQYSDTATRNVVILSKIVDHPLVKHLAKSTMYRSIASLEDRGLLVPIKSGYNTEYTLNLRAL